MKNTICHHHTNLKHMNSDYKKLEHDVETIYLGEREYTTLKDMHGYKTMHE